MGLKEEPPSLFCRAKADTQWVRPSLLQSRLLKTVLLQGFTTGLGSPSRLCPCPRGRPGATGTGGGGIHLGPYKESIFWATVET